MAKPLLPDVIIGGAPRSGTTYLCEALDRHPGIHVARPVIPEPKVLIAPVKHEDEYRQRYAQLFSGADPERCWVEKTSYYLESAHSCEIMHRIVPDACVLFMLREPVARAYSNYLWTRNNNLESLSFMQAVDLENSRENPLDDDRSYARPFDYLCRGNYAPMLKRYIESLGRDRVGIFLFEELHRRPEDLLLRVQKFIGIDAVSFDTLDAGIVNSASDFGPALDPGIEHELRQRVSLWVEATAKITGIDLASAWGY